MESRQIVHVKKLREQAVLPAFQTEYSAGADLYACLEEPVVIGPGETAFLPTGLAMELPAGYAGMVFARSGMACKRGLAPANKVGVIDADYRGEVTVALYNHGSVPQTVSGGDRIAQLVILPVLLPLFEECGDLSETKRGAGGFGSTGKN